MSKVDWEAIREEWEGSKITFKALAEKHNVKIGTLKSRRSREKWNRDATGGERDATTVSKKSTSNKKKKRGGNPNPTCKFPKRNQAARTHGLYSKYLPKDTKKLMKVINEMDPSDMIWEQIIIQYAAIVRAQKIMFVKNKDDHSQFKKKEMIVESYTDENDVKTDRWIVEYDNVAAWEKYSGFLASQSRAMGELRNLIKQFVSMADEMDERRLKIEAMQASIKKTNAEIKRLQGDDLDEYESDGFIEAMVGVEDVWNDTN